jgi:hypothetical protein
MTVSLVVAVVWGACIAAAQPVAQPDSESARTATSDSFLLSPPKDGGPVVVRASFKFHDIDAINDEAETFEFTGVLTLKWHDKRQAFDPVAEGLDEKIYSGDYQFNELSPSWFPQVVFVNSSSSYESHGVVLRVQPDGTTTLIEKLNAVAKTELNLRRFPFDTQRLEAVFEVLGFDNAEVVLQVESETTGWAAQKLWIPQWIVTGIDMSTRDRLVSHLGRQFTKSALIMNVDVQRESFYVSRLVTLPLLVIVLLSFSVFWMERSSLGDRISISFIGILTVVAYQVVMSEILPRIAYVNWMNGFLNFSLLVMGGTVIVNLAVGALEQQGRSELAHLIDHRCRWIFPLTYFGFILFLFAVAFLIF